MAHHGDYPKGMDAINKMMRELRLGPTGLFPQGELNDDDEGEIRIGVTQSQGKVVLAFGKHIDWVGFDAEQARELARLFLDRAQECDGIKAVIRRIQGSDE